MDCQVGNRKKRAPGIDIADIGIIGIVTAEHDFAGQGQGTVQPGAADHAAIKFNIEFPVILCMYPGMGLDTQAGKIRMGSGDVQVTPRFPADAERQQGRAEYADIV